MKKWIKGKGMDGCLRGGRDGWRDEGGDGEMDEEMMERARREIQREDGGVYAERMNEDMEV